MTIKNTDLEALMRQALGGDKRAYANLLRETVLILRPFLMRRLNSEDEVDDVLQEILLSIHKARHTYDGLRPYKPWVYAIAKFRLLDYLRKYYADQLHFAVDMSEVENFKHEEIFEKRINYESVSEKIHKLPKKQALILQMVHKEGYTIKEVAEKIGMSETAVKVAAFRAYKALRQQLEE